MMNRERPPKCKLLDNTLYGRGPELKYCPEHFVIQRMDTMEFLGHGWSWQKYVGFASYHTFKELPLIYQMMTGNQVVHLVDSNWEQTKASAPAGVKRRKEFDTRCIQVTYPELTQVPQWKA